MAARHGNLLNICTFAHLALPVSFRESNAMIVPARFRSLFALALLVPLLSGVRHAAAQDLYDTTALRTVNLQFHDANGEALLRSYYDTDTYILADLT